MSLYGALYSGVSGLTAQSSAMGAISDNITNVSTIGYKNTNINFQTLVTKQTSTTFYSAGGVQSRPRQAVDVQGLLQASTSQTDLAISGGGFFVVNEASRPTGSDAYFYTRAGSFKQNSEGFLANSGGYFLQGWPTDASGNIIPANDSLTQTNLNVISNDYLDTINLSRVAGSAAATDQITIGANLPTNAVAGDSFNTDVQFYDTLGGARSMNISYTKSGTDNIWTTAVLPPQGTTVVTAFDPSGDIYDSTGRLDFDAVPADGSVITIDGINYEFDSDASVSGANIAVTITASSTVGAATQALVDTVNGHDTDFTTDNNRIDTHPDDSTMLLFQDDGTGIISVNPSGLLDINGAAATDQTAAFDVAQINASYTDYGQFTFAALPADNELLTINGIKYGFDTVPDATVAGSDVIIDISGGATVATMLASLKTAIETNDPNYAAGAIKLREAAGITPVVNDTIIIPAIPSATTASVDATGLTTPPTALGATLTAASKWDVTTTGGIVFDSKGLPLNLNMHKLQILGLTNGAANMDDNSASMITLDFGIVGGTDGMTQFGSEFSPTSIDANGSRFGTFSGVSIGPDGLMTALFDNGDTRPIFRIPISTFVNPNGLEGRTGNVWNASEASGSYTLRTAGSGAAGSVTQASLEASTVDIGSEFTQMIVVQRAYSASTKIISTADQMLEELMRTKR